MNKDVVELIAFIGVLVFLAFMLKSLGSKNTVDHGESGIVPVEPEEEVEEDWIENGYNNKTIYLSIYEHIATEAMTALIAKGGMPDTTAVMACQFARAMLKELEKELG